MSSINELTDLVCENIQKDRIEACDEAGRLLADPELRDAYMEAWAFKAMLRS